MLLFPIHAEHHCDRLWQLGDRAPKWHDLQLMAARCSALVGDNHLLLCDDEGITSIAVDGEPCAVELPPSPCCVLHEAVEVLILVADVGKPEFDAGAVAL